MFNLSTGRIPLRSVPLIIAVAFVLAACGSPSATPTTAPATPTTAPSGPSGSTAAPTTVPATSPPTATLPHKTIGILNINNADAAAAGETQAVIDAAKVLGWDTTVIDAGGDPTKMAQGMQTLVTQGVDGILTLAIEPAIIQAGLTAAQAHNIPVVDFGGLVTKSPLIAAQVAPSDFTLTSMLDFYMIEKMHGTGKLFVETSNLIAAFTNRFNLLQMEVAALGPDIQIVGTHEVDFANLFDDTQRSVASALQTDPDINAIWVVAAPQVAPAAQAVKAAGKQGQVDIVGFFGTPQNLDEIRNGDAAAIIDFDVTQNSWMALDQFVQYFGTQRPIDSVNNFAVPLQYALLTSANTPASGLYQYPFDYKSYIINKWKSQFANVTGG